MNKKNYRLLFNIIGFILVIICFIFIFRIFIKIDLTVIRDKINIFWIFNIILFSFLYFIIFQLQGITWNFNFKIITDMNINIFEMLSIYSRMNIAKYIPGNIFVFVGRHIALKKYGISDFKLVLLNALEIVCFLGISLFICFIGILTGILNIPEEILKRINFKLLILILFLAVVIIIIVIIYFNEKIINGIIRLLTLNKIIRFILNLFLYLLYFLIYGFINVLFFKVFLGIDISLYNTIYIIIVFSLAWVLGYIVPGASGGIGIRESVLLIILSPHFGYTNVFIVAVLSRLITLFGEVISFFIIPTLNKIYKWNILHIQKKNN